jgi:anti-anti-sigma factor
MRQTLEKTGRGALAFAIGRDPREVRLAVVGELDLASADSLVSTATRLLREPCERLCVNLGGVNFCDATGISALIRVHRLAARDGVELVIADTQPAVAHVFAIVRLAEVIPSAGAGG